MYINLVDDVKCKTSQMFNLITSKLNWQISEALSDEENNEDDDENNDDEEEGQRRVLRVVLSFLAILLAGGQVVPFLLR